MIGKQLSHFRIVEKIGEGGMGVVYRAEDSKLGRHVALKVMRPEFVASEDRRQRFIREARTAASVTHPNIVTVHEIGEADGVTFIAMELLEGKGLTAHIGGRPLIADEAIRIAVDVAEGLARAHAAGVIHRDLKPDNVIIGRGGQVTVLDFGLAKLHDESSPADSEGSDIQTVSLNATRDGRILGTAAYMSPEQARGLPVDSRSDIFSFGVLLYEMVTGRTPFIGPTITDTLTAILRDRQAPIASFNPDVPAELERILNRCLEKNPADRYQDTEHLVEDLRALKRVTDSNSQPLPRVSLSGDAHRPAVPFWLRPGILVFATVAMAALVLAMVLPRWFSKPAVPADRASVAVLPFTNMQDGNDTDRFGQILQELIITDLSGLPSMNVYSSQRLFDIQKRLGRSDTRTIDRDMASQVAREAGAGTMLTGSVSQLGDRWILTSQLVDVDRGTVMGSERIDGADLYVMVDDLTKRIRDNLGHDIDVAMAGDLAVRDRTSSSIEAYQTYLRGNELLEDLKFGEAVEVFRDAVRIDPDFGQAHYKLAIASWWHRGLEDKNAPAGDDPPGEILATLLSGDLKLTEKDRMLARALLPLVEHRYDDATALYRKLVQRYPDEKEAWYGLGEALRHGSGRMGAETLKAFETAIDLDPAFRLAYYHAAEIYEAKGLCDEGVRRLTQLVELYPDDPVWRAKYAGLVVCRGDDAEAQAVIRDAIQKTPNADERRDLLATLAEAQFRRGALEAGLALIERGIAIESDKPPKRLLLLLAEVNGYQQRLGDAEKIYRDLLAADPTDRDAVLGLYDVYDEQRRYGEARKLIRRSIEADPQSVYYWRWIDLAVKLGDPTEVDRVIEAGLEQNPGDGYHGRTRAHLLDAAEKSYREVGDFVQAEEVARLAMGDDPKAEDHGRLGWALTRLGRHEEAAGSFQAGLKLDAGNVDCLRGLVRLGLGDRDFDSAIKNGELCAKSDQGGRGQMALLEAYAFSGMLAEADALLDAVLHEFVDIGNRLEVIQGAAEIFIRAGQYEPALARVRQAQEMMGGLPIPGLAARRVWALIKLNRIDEAKNAVRQALSAAPRHWLLNIEDAGLRLADGDPAAAERTARDLVTNGPAHGEAFVLLATALAEQGQHAKALEYARKRVAMDPDRSGKTLLAWVLIDGDLDVDEGIRIAEEARGWAVGLGDASVTFPYHASPEHCLGLAYLKKGDPIKAATFLRQASEERPDRPSIGEHLRQAVATRASLDP